MGNTRCVEQVSVEQNDLRITRFLLIEKISKHIAMASNIKYKNLPLTKQLIIGDDFRR